MVSSSQKDNKKRRVTPSKLALIVVGALFGTVLGIYLAAVVASVASSVPVTFINDSQSSVILPDCGTGQTGIAAGTSAVVTIDGGTKYCSIDDVTKTQQIVLGACLRMPIPLRAHDTVRISDATSDTRPCR